MNTDRIEKHIVLWAPRARVWRAIANADEFGTWFGATLTGVFAPGAQLTGHFTAPGSEHLTLNLMVEQVEPEHLLSYRWHPFASEAGEDYANEPTTLVEIHLAETAAGTAVMIIESGFDQLPLARRATAFQMHEGGWAEQLTNITRYVTA